MKILIVLFSLVIALQHTSAQSTAEPLASFTGGTITAQQLSPHAQEEIAKIPTLAAEARKQMLSQKVGALLLAKEAAATKTTVSGLIKTQSAKIKDPTDAQIQAVYDANRNEIGSRSLAEVRNQIVSYIRRDTEHKAVRG